MQLSPFQKEHKANLEKMSKKELINQILIWIDIHSNIQIEREKDINTLNKQNNDLEWYLKSSESALAYKDTVIENYKQILEFAIEMP